MTYVKNDRTEMGTYPLIAFAPDAAADLTGLSDSYNAGTKAVYSDRGEPIQTGAGPTAGSTQTTTSLRCVSFPDCERQALHWPNSNQ